MSENNCHCWDSCVCDTKFKALESQLSQAREEIEKLKADSNKSMCAYCGHLTEKTPGAILEHMAICEKHPTVKLLKKCVEQESKLSKLEEVARCAKNFKEDVAAHSGMFHPDLNRALAALRETEK